MIINGNNLITMYMQVVDMPIESLYVVYPDLDDPSNELQYQLLKLQYYYQGIADVTTLALQQINNAFKELGEKIMNSFAEVYDDSELALTIDKPTKHFDYILKRYNYQIDVRNLTRRYSRNHVY